MKLTIFIMTTFLLQVSAAGFAQKLTFNKKDASLKQLFSEVRLQTGYNVLWQDGKISDELTFNANFNKTPLDEVLTTTLNANGLSYSIVNKTIVVKKKELPLLESIANFFASVDIGGKVLDAETGKPIPQVTIKLKGTQRMVFANENGTFMFNAVPEEGTLVVSVIGYKSQEVKPAQSLVVKLTPEIQALDDVVISTGYQKINKQTATGSFVVLSEKDIQSSPAINLMSRLEGMVPGVQFNVRGNSIEIRGSNGYYGGTPPLIVIDGFPSIDETLTKVTNTTSTGGPILNNFNIADIESITFLKDAAASAIWGAKAANGVIVITTKKGRKNTSSINFGTTLSISDPANFSNMTNMTNRQYIDLEQELVDNNFILDPVKNGYRSAPVSEAQEWMLKVKRGTATEAQRDAALEELASRSNTDQIKQYLLQKAVTQQYNLSFSGGGNNSSYYISGSYNKDIPVFRSNYAQSYNLTSNLTNEFLNKRIVLETGINYAYSKSSSNSSAQRALSYGSFGLAPYDMIVDQNGDNLYRGILFTKEVADGYTNKGYLPWTYNPVDELNYNNSVSTQNAIRLTGSLKGVVTNWLNLTVSGQLQKNLSNNSYLQELQSYNTRELINIGTTISNTGAFNYGVPMGAVYQIGRTNADAYSVRGQLNINKNWNDVHHFNLIAGTEIRETSSSGNSQTLYGYDVDRSTYVNVNTTTTGSYPNIYGATSRLPADNTIIARSLRRYLSYYANGSYSYLNKYFVTASVRFDDINILGVDRRDRAKPLWSTGLRWDIKKEDILAKTDWVNALSFRITMGTGGNAPTSSNNYSTISTAVDPNTKLPYASILNYANQNIGWSVTKMINTGVDAFLFNNRLNLSLDVFTKRTYDLIMQIPISATYGVSTLDVNAGDLAGNGVDLGLTGRLVKTKDWEWSQTLNFSYNTTKVTDTRFPSKSTSAGTELISGYPVDNLFVYRWAGLDETGQSQIYTADGSILKSGPGTAALKPEDKVYAGRTTAPYFGGYMNTIRYKEFSLLVRATYNLGHKFLLTNIDASKYPKGNSVSGLLSNSSALADRWRKLGDELTTDVPGLVYSNINSVNRYAGADINVRDAGNISLQQISLNYTVPQSFFKKISFVKSLNVSATVSNLGMIWVANKEGINPNYQNTSTFSNLPPSRTYLFNVNLTL